MSESNSTTVETNNGELRYYEQLEKHINSLGPKFREKYVIKQNIYNEIIKCLLLPKGKSTGSCSPKFICWVKHRFILSKIAGVDVACCIKSKKSICIYENYYSMIGEAHGAVSHGGRIFFNKK